MTTSLPRQISAGELAVFERRLSSEIVTLKKGIAGVQTDFKNDKIEIGIYANSCNTIFNGFVEKLLQHYPEAILKTLYSEHYPLEATQGNFQQEMGALQNSRAEYEIEEAEFKQQVVKLNDAFFAILIRD